MYQVLLVDDEALTREGISENVPWERYGCELAGSCENGKEALEFIETTPVDVVLTDICMPFMDGMQLAGKLHEEYPDINIIIFSGYDEFEYAKMAIRYNVKEYLLKPVTAMELGEVLLKLTEEMDRDAERRNRDSEMRTSYHKGQILLYSNALCNLISGCKTESESRRELEEVGVHLDAASYRVAVAELDVYTRSDKLNEEVKKESALMAFVLYNIAEEIVGRYQAGKVCQGKDHRTFILFYTDAPARFRQTAGQICQDIIKQMNETMHLDVNIGMGDYKESFGDIYRSCEEAEEALEYHYILGGNRVLEIEKIRDKQSHKSAGAIPSDLIRHIKESSETGILEDIRGLGEQFREFCYDRRTIELILQRMIDEADEVRRGYEVEDTSVSDKAAVLAQVLEAGGLEEAMAVFESYLRKLTESLSQRRDGTRRYARMAMDYIDKNYSNADLNLHSVCSYLNISTSRFSSLFKNSTGMTFMEMVTNVRMQKARELLDSTDMKNYEIADRVGFSDPHYFSIAFKKATGQSPTEYAKEMRK